MPVAKHNRLAAVVTSDPFSMKFPFPPVKCCDHIMCTKDWYPVCAGDTVSPPRTFPNMCELDRYNCYSGNNLEILYNEECKPQKKFPPQCCTKYLPVCAGDGTVTAKSFGNKCLMELYNNVNGMKEMTEVGSFMRLQATLFLSTKVVTEVGL
uniref:Kazal-like domain-containing protein n=1 Tax=Timema cristinae TaxID=61476 RepID=A0A7R9CTW5_TIMCR|nr:unnamed protein product [Timema cristinae]